MLTPYLSRLRRAGGDAAGAPTPGVLSVRLRPRFESSGLEPGLAPPEPVVVDAANEIARPVAQAQPRPSVLTPVAEPPPSDAGPAEAPAAPPTGTQPASPERATQPPVLVEHVTGREPAAEPPTESTAPASFAAARTARTADPVSASTPARELAKAAGLPPAPPIEPPSSVAPPYRLPSGEAAENLELATPRPSTAYPARDRPTAPSPAPAASPDPTRAPAQVVRRPPTAAASSSRSEPVGVDAPSTADESSTPEVRSPRPEAVAPVIARAAALAVGQPSAGPRRPGEDPRPLAKTEVTVTIGRLEVRAQPASPERPAQPRAPRRRPTTLDQYLRSRSTGRSG